jgi:hypothetical protein
MAKIILIIPTKSSPVIQWFNAFYFLYPWTSLYIPAMPLGPGFFKYTKISKFKRILYIVIKLKNYSGFERKNHQDKFFFINISLIYLNKCKVFNLK